MTKFIEYTDLIGHRVLVNVNGVKEVLDRNKTIVITLDNVKVQLPIAYTTFKYWLLDKESAILEAGTAL